MLLKLAVRNVQRNKRRSLLAVLSVMLALALVVVLQGMIDGMMENMILNATKNESGHIRITTKTYMENIRHHPVHYLVHQSEELRNELLNHPQWAEKIELITFRMRFGVLLQYEGNNKAAYGIGGDAEAEKDLLMLERAIVDGRYLSGQVIEENGRRYREVIVGRGMADILDIGVGDSFSVMLQGADYGIRIPRFQVVGVFQTGLAMMDDTIFQMDLADAMEVLRTDGGVQEVLLFLDDYRQAPALAREITAWLEKDERWMDTVAVSWRDAGGMVGMMEQTMPIYTLIYLIVMFLGMIIIFNIMMMIVLERKREIGILKAMGLKSREVLGLFLYDGLILGLIGSISGVLLGVVINIPLSIWGVDLSASIANMNLPLDPILRWRMSVGGVVGSLVLGLVVSVVVSILPARIAARMKPVDAIRSV